MGRVEVLGAWRHRNHRQGYYFGLSSGVICKALLRETTSLLAGRLAGVMYAPEKDKEIISRSQRVDHNGARIAGEVYPRTD